MSIVSYEYAKALFDLALEQEDKNIILDFEKKFNDVVEACKQEPKFMKLMLTPSVGDKEKKELVKEIFHTTQNTFEHFLYVLIDNKRIEIVIRT